MKAVGMAMNRNLTLKMGNCPHPKYIPHLGLVRSGAVDPVQVLCPTRAGAQRRRWPQARPGEGRAGEHADRGMSVRSVVLNNGF